MIQLLWGEKRSDCFQHSWIYIYSRIQKFYSKINRNICLLNALLNIVYISFIIIGQNLKIVHFPSIGKGINTLWYIYAMEYYFTIYMQQQRWIPKTLWWEKKSIQISIPQRIYTHTNIMICILKFGLRNYGPKSERQAGKQKTQTGINAAVLSRISSLVKPQILLPRPSTN